MLTTGGNNAAEIATPTHIKARKICFPLVLPRLDMLSFKTENATPIPETSVKLWKNKK